MILLDTQVWIWWASQDPRLPIPLRDVLEGHEGSGLGVSDFSVWEVAKKVERGKLALASDLDNWLALAVRAPGIVMLPVTREVLVEATRLPGFHRDPADQIVVATARVHAIPLATTDSQIRAYPHVQLVL